MAGCGANVDANKLVRDGASQPQRGGPALDPAFAPLTGHGPAQALLFARAYAGYLVYYGQDGKPDGVWTPFFDADEAVLLALAAVQDTGEFRSGVADSLEFLNQRDNASNAAELRNRLGYLFSSAATLAAGLDRLMQGLPPALPLVAVLRNLVRSRLAPALLQLMLYHRDGLAPAAPPPGPYHSDVAAPFAVLGERLTFAQVMARSLSDDWIADGGAGGWSAYRARAADLSLHPPTGVYGSGGTLFERVNHLATHNLFTGAFDRFLKAYARVVTEAGSALQASFTSSDSHQPHYALLLAFVRLLETVRADMNTFTARHLAFYYKEVLRLKEQPPQPGKARLVLELARQAQPRLVAAGTRFKAGKDGLGKEVVFESTRDVVINHAKVARVSALYRHDAEPLSAAPADKDAGRLFASPAADSADGLGAALDSSDGSWQPFHNKRYIDGKLSDIVMPMATIGFALASHYLLLAQGVRTITLEFTLDGTGLTGDFSSAVSCRLTCPGKWLEVPSASMTAKGGKLTLVLGVTEAHPPITPYQPKEHGYALPTALPVLLVELKQDPTREYAYGALQDVKVSGWKLLVDVHGLRSLSVSNDFGPVDVSKPFQPYGAAPVAGSSMVVGSSEAFQKQLTQGTLTLTWLASPIAYNTTPKVKIEYLKDGKWDFAPTTPPIGTTAYSLAGAFPVLDQPDLAGASAYDVTARHGFVRFSLDAGIGLQDYQLALAQYLAKGGTLPTPVPVVPVVAGVSLDYTAVQKSGTPAAALFQLAPFGYVVQPAFEPDVALPLLPQFGFASKDAGTESAGECYIGVSGLEPPQNLSLLVQVVPGSADPQVGKPANHVQWSYLSANQWIAFAPHDVDDQTSGLVQSGIVTLPVPRAATTDNTVLPAGLHWIRISVATKADAVCRLLSIAAQGIEVQFADQQNDPAFTERPLPAGTITRLVAPDPAIKQVSQPFAGYGGRGAETAPQFRTRVSERLRHKDRGIALWDVEHLVLQAFPGIWRAKCLNHTEYDPGAAGGTVYRELAPGHVTLVTIPDSSVQGLRDPLRPYTGLDVLGEIERFLRPRMPCFVQLHVHNPQFEEVRVAFRVRLLPGVDEGYYLKLLREEVTRFLSPWAYPGGGMPGFGGKVRKSALIDFVEERSYVDYVADFRMHRDLPGAPGSADLEEVEGSTAVSVLVSARPSSHEIEPIGDDVSSAAAETCPCEAP